MNLSSNLKKIRKENNLSQEDLAEKLGVSRQSVSKWESNQAYPEMDKVIQLCKMFNLNIDELLNQDVDDKKDSEIRKNKFNNQVDSFLNFITKTVNMFSAMKFKNVIKCLFEQLFLILVFYIIYSFCNYFISSMFYDFSFLPRVLINMFTWTYTLCYIVLVVVVMLHIFKLRYLDYYEIIDKQDDVKTKDKEEKEIKNDIKHNNEKIIIRDPERSSIKFFSLIAKMIVIIFKAFVGCFSLMFVFSFIFIAMCLALSFLIVKTGLLFVGCLLLGVGALLVNSLIIVVIYNFIFNGKNKWNLYLAVFLISLLLIGLGIGNIIIGLKDFNFVDYSDNNLYTTEELNVKLDGNLKVYYSNIEYILTDDKDVKIKFVKPNYSTEKLYVTNNEIFVHYEGNNNIFEAGRYLISAINNKYIIGDIDGKIYIYTNKENMSKINRY